jgi:hypothetical protein
MATNAFSDDDILDGLLIIKDGDEDARWNYNAGKKDGDLGKSEALTYTFLGVQKNPLPNYYKVENPWLTKQGWNVSWQRRKEEKMREQRGAGKLTTTLMCRKPLICIWVCNVAHLRQEEE